jgi:hypothetical protein
MARMKSQGDPAPSTAFYKNEGKWSFFTYPNEKQKKLVSIPLGNWQTGQLSLRSGCGKQMGALMAR